MWQPGRRESLVGNARTKRGTGEVAETAVGVGVKLEPNRVDVSRTRERDRREKGAEAWRLNRASGEARVPPAAWTTGQASARGKPIQQRACVKHAE
jgi:hypothetical protein